MKIDFSNWKEFKYSDIFEIKKGFYNKKPEHTSEGNIPFLGATEKNNGVTEYYSIEDIKNASKTGNDKNSSLELKLFPPHSLCITNNGSVGFAYYQDQVFTCSHDVNPLYIKKGTFNKYTALFVATIIKKDRYRWAYGRKWRPDRMKDSTIMLPTDSKGNPDWDFMELYMKSLKFKNLSTKNKIINSQKIFTPLWKDFLVKDILKIYNGKGITQEEIEEHPGSFPVVQSGADNNGVLGFIDLEYCKEMNYTISEEMCLTVARTGSAGYISFQKEGCVVGDSAKILILKENPNIYRYLFIQTLLMKNNYKYTYGRKVTEKQYLNLTLKLPTKNNNIDWEYMENYIKGLPFGDKL